MSKAAARDLIDDVKAIGTQAKKLLDTVQTRATDQGKLSAGEIKQIAALVAKSEALLLAANQRAKTARDQQIVEFEEHIRQINSSLSTPGLSATAVSDLKALKRSRRAKLVRLQARAALDFGGILTTADVADISRVLKNARTATEKKQKATDFIASLVKIADLAINITGKAGKLV